MSILVPRQLFVNTLMCLSKLIVMWVHFFSVIARPTHVSPPPRLYNINRVTYKGGYMSRTQSKYDWPHHIAQQKSSGLSVKEYSAQHGFSPLSFYVAGTGLILQ